VANASATGEPFLQLVGISKSYPGVQALSDVSLSINAGEVLGLVGENGAGKSTLMKVLGGVVEPTAGVIRIDGNDRQTLTVNDAINAGIAFVHQELNLFENLDAAGNVFIGREPLTAGPLKLIDRRRLHALVTPLLNRLGCDFTADTPVADLSIAQRQLLEIAKALSLNARVVIMDEPTSSLTITETNRLLKVVSELRDDGVAIVFISHRLHEVEQCADRVVALRDGRIAGGLDRNAITYNAMIRLMIGRDLKSLYSPPKTAVGDAVLDLSEVTTSTYPQQKVSLTLHAGEILGLAGLVGAGRTELARAIFGVDRMLAGTIRLSGRPIAVRSPHDAIKHGIYLAPEDRKRDGLILDLSVAENISLANMRELQSAGGLVDRAREIANAETQRRALNIRVPGVDSQARTLSGGNQQKVVLGKWLSMRPRALIFDEPTRGIDVGAKTEIYELMRQLANNGVAILMISSDLEEIIGVSDRVAVMHEGAISGILPRTSLSENAVMQLATGSHERGDHLS
jgi:ribose transport system ATP-binding protein